MRDTIVVTDVESDGPVIGENSMVCFGAVILGEDGNMDKTFYGQTAPVSGVYDPEALAISGFTRQQHLGFEDPQAVMDRFEAWLKENCPKKPVLVSDNNGYDASWINYYFHSFTGDNPFGWSSRRIGDMFCGFFKKGNYRWKKHRKTSHTHHPVDDAKGNAEALWWLIQQGFDL
jgi:hypothetical protein